MGVNQGTRATPREDLGEALMEYRLEGGDSKFIATDVLPILPTQKESSTASVITREGLLKRVDAKRAKRGSFNRIDIEAEDLAFLCEEYGLEGPLDDSERAMHETDFDAEATTVESVDHKLKMEQEIRVKDLVFDTAVWTGAALFTDNSGAPWDNVASDAIAHVLDAKEKVRRQIGMNPNSLIIGQVTMNNLLQNTGIKARFPGVDILTEEMLKRAMGSIFGLKNVFVGDKAYDSADEGLDATISDVWGDDYASVALVAPQGASIKTPCIGRTFVWTKRTPANTVVEEYREEQTTSDVFRVRQYSDEKIFEAAFAHLMQVDA